MILHPPLEKTKVKQTKKTKTLSPSLDAEDLRVGRVRPAARQQPPVRAHARRVHARTLRARSVEDAVAGRVHSGGPRPALVGGGQADLGAGAGVDVEEEELVALRADDGVAAVEPGLLLFWWGWGSGQEEEERGQGEQGKSLSLFVARLRDLGKQEGEESIRIPRVLFFSIEIRSLIAKCHPRVMMR